MRISILLGFALFVSPCAWSSGPVTYEYAMKYRYFMEEGVFLQEVSNKAANDMVDAGIASNDLLIEELTLGALGGFAGYVTNSLPGPFGRLPSRTFSEVPGLKEFLIAEWREWHGKTGYNADAAYRRAMERWDKLPRDIDGQWLPVGIDEMREALTASSSSWTLIPQVLCVFWPTDAEVLEFLWEFRDKDLSPQTPLKVLDLLLLGAFSTPEADNYRTETIQLALSEVNEAESSRVALAAVGLALSRPTHALPLLIRSAEEYPLVRSQILMALAAYSDEDLATHARELTPLLEGVTLTRPMGPEIEAHERLNDLLGAGTPSETRP